MSPAPTPRRRSVHVEVSRRVFAPPRTVWETLTDWERQPEWMVDALAVEVLGERREGVGVRLRCPTRVLGVTVQDVMEVTVWEPPHRLVVRHLGRVIAGEGGFELQVAGVGTSLVWRERVEPPLGVLGKAAAVAARPYLRWLFGRSLDCLKHSCEREARRQRALAGTGDDRG